jgi:hypothetical protein
MCTLRRPEFFHSPIAADTLTWHLNRPNAALIQEFFATPSVRLLALPLAILRADRRGIAAARETERRRAPSPGTPSAESARRKMRLPKANGSSGRRYTSPKIASH